MDRTAWKTNRCCCGPLRCNRILFTEDEDLLALAHRYQKAERFFAGVVYAHQQHVSIGRCINDLEIISKASSAEEMANHVEFLPL